MPSVTTWTRIEPRNQNEINIGLQARVEDPLWLLARQWQMGEFRAEDAGTPVLAHVQGDAYGIARLHSGRLSPMGSGAARPFDSGVEPLEPAVERDFVLRGPAPDLRFAVDAGRYFMRQLELKGAAPYRGPYQQAYLLQAPTAPQLASVDLATQRFWTSVAARVTDGARLYADLRVTLRPDGGSPTLPPTPVVPDADQPKVLAAAQAWLAWYEAQVSEPQGNDISWQNDRMEYAFSVALPTPNGEIVLEVPEYTTGRVEWDTFSVRKPAVLGSSPGEMRREAISKKLIPAPATYPGMPADRWWEFEDANVHFGAATPGTEDLAGLVMLQFALIYGNDWFVLPLELPVGSLCSLAVIAVTDSFGGVKFIQPFEKAGGVNAGWRLWTTSGSGAALDASGFRADAVFVPPSLGPMLQGPPVEEVLLLRDEMANLAWGVEHIFEGRAGVPVNRRDAWDNAHPAPQQTTAAAVAAGVPSSPAVYCFATEVPDYWIPLVPVRDSITAPIRLRRGTIPGPEGSGSVSKGRLLSAGVPLALFDEEVPRAGARVTRNWQYARWIDGSRHLWIGTRKEPGRGEGSSGLRFDTIANGTTRA